MSRDLIVFDMDGVLVDVADSYRETIVCTVEHFTGKRIERPLIQEYKNEGGWNNDWALSQKIAADLGVEVEFDTIVEYFNRIFFGNGDGDGLIYREKWIAKPGMLERLNERYDFAIFTGRMMDEAEITLRRFAAGLKFHPIVAADDPDVTNHKPAPDGLLKIARCRPGTKLWYIGDTVDDARSARAAGVPFIGVAAPGSPRAEELTALLKGEGAIAVVGDINELERML